MTRFERTPAPFAFLAISLSLVLVFLLDLFTRLGIAVWVFYFLPLTLSYFVCGHSYRSMRWAQSPSSRVRAFFSAATAVIPPSRD
jgi:hypothetical protein